MIGSNRGQGNLHAPRRFGAFGGILGDTTKNEFVQLTRDAIENVIRRPRTCVTRHAAKDIHRTGSYEQISASQQIKRHGPDRVQIRTGRNLGRVVKAFGRDVRGVPLMRPA